MPIVRQTIREEMQGDPPRIDRGTIEGLAEHAYDAREADPAGRFHRDSARGIALGQGVEVATDGTLPLGCDGLAVLELLLVIVRPSTDSATEALRILHELAHLILQRLGWRHSHADVWILALAMGAPRSMLRAQRQIDGVGLAALSRLPAWAAAERLDMHAAAAE
jgi:hypothetical protein